MGMTLDEAKKLEGRARQAVEEKTRICKEAKKAFDAAREALENSENARLEAKSSMEELQLRLKVTRDAIMPNEAASKRAQMELESTQHALARVHDERAKAEQALSRLETKRDHAEELLCGAEKELQKTDANESTSRVSLDERVQRATDAQRALDAALKAIEEGKEEVARQKESLDEVRNADSSLPQDDESLNAVLYEKQAAFDKSVKVSQESLMRLQEARQSKEDAEKAAAEAKEAYEKAQENLRTAIAAADKAEARIHETQTTAELGEEEQQLHAEALADYTAAQDVRSAAMTINAQALTRLADADVEAIRIRIVCDQAATALDAANAKRARTERELREAREALEQSEEDRKASHELVREHEALLHEAVKKLEELEAVGKRAAQENASAQKELRDTQELAVRYGKENRDAADILDEYRHELSDVVAAIEDERNQLMLLKQKEGESAAKVDAAYSIRQEADKELQEARSFIERAEKEIEAQRSAMRDAEKRSIDLGAALRSADEAYSVAQRNLDVANSELTDAEVSVIMAEIDSHY